MSAEYSGEEVRPNVIRERAKVLHGYSQHAHNAYGELCRAVIDHLNAYADLLERIKADEATKGRIDFKGMWNAMSDRAATHPPEQVDVVARPCREAVERSASDFLKEKLGEVPAFQMAEDGDENWSFWVTEDGCSDDTTSYVHADLSIEWYGTAWEAPTAAPVVQAAQVDAAPIPMVLHCPSCRMQHIDAPETHHVDRALDEAGMDNSYSASWDNPPHRSHLCHGCGTIWRPADVPTIGVTATKTHGKADTFKPAAECVPEGWRQALERALPFLDDEAGKYEDDGNNEPLDVADTIRDLLAAPSPGESA